MVAVSDATPDFGAAVTLAATVTLLRGAPGAMPSGVVDSEDVTKVWPSRAATSRGTAALT